MDIAALAAHISRTIEASGNAKAIYGEPIKLETHTVVPVAALVVTVGGGGGALSAIGGGGGGLTMKVAPVGYLHEKDGVVTFTPIDVPPQVLASPADAAHEKAPSPSLIEKLRERLRT